MGTGAATRIRQHVAVVTGGDCAAEHGARRVLVAALCGLRCGSVSATVRSAEAGELGSGGFAMIMANVVNNSLAKFFSGYNYTPQSLFTHIMKRFPLPKRAESKSKP